MSDTINAGDVIGKTLIGRTRISVFRDASNSAVSFATVAAGQPVGVVDSYLMPGENRAVMWWMFKDPSNQFYYTPHKVNYFDVSDLKKQGVLTVDEKLRAEQEVIDRENLPWWEFLVKKYGVWILLAGLAFKAVPAVIDNAFKSRK